MPSVLSHADLAEREWNTHPHEYAVPVEVLDAIVSAALSEKHAFVSIASFSLASYRLRQIALRRFFVRFYAQNSSHWNHICQIPGMYDWVRILECSTKTLTQHPDYLRHFINLQAVELDFSTDGLATQHSRCKLLLPNLPSNLVQLRLYSLPQITPALLTQISLYFPHLLALELTCAERLDETCCWLCFEESSSCTVHSPLSDIYSTLDDLMAAFSTALEPLQTLEHLTLGVFLSELDMFYDHLAHRDLDAFGSVDDIALPYGPDDCDDCAVRHAAHVRMRELWGSAAIASSLGALKTISWSTFFARYEPGDDRPARMTTMWVRRSSGRVEVRRAPWSSLED